MAALIGYNNLLDTATVTASVGVAAAAHDYLTTTAWAPGNTATLNADTDVPVAADYVGVVSTGCDSITLAYHNGSAWVDVATVTNPGTVWFASFASATSQAWRLSVTGSAPQVRQVSVGPFLALPVKLSMPFTEPKYASRVRAHSSKTSCGQYVGRSVIATLCEVNLPLKHLTADWLETHWEAWVAHMRAKPFFFLWDSVNHSTDAAYLWLNDYGKFPTPRWKEPLFQTLSLALEGLV